MTLIVCRLIWWYMGCSFSLSLSISHAPIRSSFEFKPRILNQFYDFKCSLRLYWESPFFGRIRNDCWMWRKKHIERFGRHCSMPFCSEMLAYLLLIFSLTIHRRTEKIDTISQCSSLEHRNRWWVAKHANRRRKKREREGETAENYCRLLYGMNSSQNERKEAT